MRAPSQDLRPIPKVTAPQSRAVSFVLVAVLHVGIIYALATGLAKQMIQMLPQNINVNIIPEEQQKHEPPPPPPPTFKQPPPFVPPPDVTIDLSQAPATTTAITAQSSLKDITAPVSVGRPHTCADRYYPQEARNNNWTGTTVIKFHVSISGDVSNVRVTQSSGHDVLDNAAIPCARGWSYKPAILHGQPIESEYGAIIVWKLRN